MRPQEQDLVVSVQDLCFTQDSIGVTFARPRDQERIDDAVDLINQGFLSPRAFPNLKVVEFHDRLWSLNNRRLWVFKKAKVPSITVTLMSFDYGKFQSVMSTRLSTQLYTPGFLPRTRGYCRENFSGDPDPELPSSLLPPPTPHGRGGRHVEMPTRTYKQSFSSDHVPHHVREADRPPKRPKSPPPAKVAKVSSTKSKHLQYSDHHYHVQSDFRNHYDNLYYDRNQHSDLRSTPMTRGSVAPPPSGKYGSDHGPSRVNAKKRHHETEHRDYGPSETRQEAACFPRPPKKHRAPSPVSEFTPEPSRTPFQECSSHPAEKSRNPTHVSSFKASSRPLSSPRYQEEWPLAPHRKGLNPSMPKPPVPTPRDKPKAPRLAKVLRPPSPARRTRASERRADRPGNLPSIRSTEPKAYSSNGQQPGSRQKIPRDKRPAVSSVSKDINSQKGRAVKSSTCGAAAHQPSPPPASAPKRSSRASRATSSNPKNFSYDFHITRKRPKASKGSKKAVATVSTECLSTKLPDHALDVRVPSPASPNVTQRASPEKPQEPELLSSSTNASLSTTTKRRQIVDDNVTSDLIDPNENQGQHSGSGMSPTTKTGREQEEPEVVDVAAKGEFLSETENNIFTLDEQITPVDPELPRPPTPSTVLDPRDLQILAEILQQFQDPDTKKSSLEQTVHTKPTADTLQKEPVDVHQAPANVAVTVTAGLEPPKIQAYATPALKEVMKPQAEPKASSAKAGRAIDHQQGKRAFSRRKGILETARTTNSEIGLGLPKTAQANPVFGNEVQEGSKRITRGQTKKQKEVERKKEREKRRALREAEKDKERKSGKSSSKENPASASKNLTTAIVPYDPTRSKDMSTGPNTLKTGDFAYVKVNGELTESGVEGRSRLHPYLRFLGPFRIARKFNAYACLLELPDDCSLKSTFSVNVMTKSRSSLEHDLPDQRLSIKLVPEMVLNKRVARRLRKRKVIHYLVKWETLPATEATWESESIFDEHPHLLDQVDSPGFFNPYLLRNWKA